jgi:hypothetical protein
MPTGGIRRFFFKLELLGQQRVDQFREFSHQHNTQKQLPHSVANVTAAQSAIVTADSKDLPGFTNTPSSASAPIHIHHFQFRPPP